MAYSTNALIRWRVDYQNPPDQPIDVRLIELDGERVCLVVEYSQVIGWRG
jgi:hypothetical protein